MEDTNRAYYEVLRNISLRKHPIADHYRANTDGSCWGWLTNWLQYHNMGYLRVFSCRTLQVGSLVCPNLAHETEWGRQLRFDGDDILHPEYDLFVENWTTAQVNCAERRWLARFNIVRRVESGILSATNLVLIPAPKTFQPAEHETQLGCLKPEKDYPLLRPYIKEWLNDNK